MTQITSLACRVSTLRLPYLHSDNTETINFSLKQTENVGLIGYNGSGKSLLMQCLAQKQRPLSGSVHWERPFYSIEQHCRLVGETVAEALGLANLFCALERVNAGNGSLADIELIGERWDFPVQWQQLTEQAGLTLAPTTQVATLSGGEQTRLALCAAFIRKHDYLLLDEPSNHLDRAGRRWLIEALKAHQGGALVVSHDVDLLNTLDTLFELSNQGLQRYGGNYQHYQQQKQQEQAAIVRRLEQVQRAMDEEKHQQQRANEKAAKRRKQGEKQRKQGSQCHLILDRRRDSAQQSQRTRNQQHSQRLDQQQKTQQYYQSLQETDYQQTLSFAGIAGRGGMKLSLQDVKLPFGTEQKISLTLRHGERLRIDGDNGSGKSTLLRCIAGELQPDAGEIFVSGQCVYLDQTFTQRATDITALNYLQQALPHLTQTELRTGLGALNLKGDESMLPMSALSGGERLKVALFAIARRAQPVDILLLDEPENHLDLPSRELLSHVIASFQGALLIVSHDDHFMENMGLHEHYYLSK